MPGYDLKKWIRFILVVFFITIISSFFVAHFSSAADKSARIRVKVAVLKNFPPQYSISEKGQPQGFAIDIIEEIAKMANLEIEYLIKDSWKEMFDALKRGQADLIPNQGITDRRKKWFAFSQPVETFPVSIFTRANEKSVSSIQSLNGKKVGVVKLNVGEVLVKDNPDIIVKKYEHVEDALYSLLSANSDALIFPEPVLWNLVRRAGIDDRLKVVGEPLSEIRRAVSVKKDNKALLNKIDAAVAKLLSSEKYKDIYLHWYGKPTPFWTVEKVAGSMTGLCIIMVLVMGTWRYRSTMRLNKNLKEQIEKRELAEYRLQKAYENLEEKVEERTHELQEALSQVKTLRGFLPICSHCKKIRDDDGYWNQIESYIHEHSDAEFSHGICPECAKKYYPEMDLYEDAESGSRLD